MSEDHKKYDPAAYLETVRRVKAAARQNAMPGARQDSPDPLGDMEVRGLLDGDIRGRFITILDGACVRGTIQADVVRVQGTFSGTIRARRVEISETAYVEGEVHYRQISVNPGAQMEARCYPGLVIKAA